MTEGVVSESKAEHAHNHGHGSQHRNAKHENADKHAAAATTLNVEGATSHHPDAAQHTHLAPVTLGVCAVAAGIVVILMGAMIGKGRTRKSSSRRWAAPETVQ